MSVSVDLISQFAKLTKEDKKSKSESTVYGEAVEYNGRMYVRIDGSELLTPVETTADIANGERVTVLIKNHNATVTGNISSPSARTDDVKDIDAKVTEIGNKIADFDIVVADKVTIKEFDAQKARIDTLVSDNVKINQSLTAAEADIDTIQAENVTITENLEAVTADIENLKTGKFANIDFSNIGKPAIEHFFSQSGLIENVVVGEQTVTGKLVGVTISGDLIEGNTIVADKLVIKGDDGLYYKLNTDGVTTEANQTDYNSINGQIIKAKSITASKISVTDLVAFGATIGGFNIGQNSIYSGVKESVDNSTRGIYMDKDGQIAIGDSENFIKYYVDQNGEGHLEISAQTVTMSTGLSSWSYATLNSKFSAYDTASDADTKVKYRKDRGIVEIRGVVTPSSDIAGSTTIHEIFTLPDGYKPDSPIFMVCQGSGNCTWLLRVNTDGEVGFSRYQNGGTTITATAGTWLPFQVMFFAK